MNSFLKTTFVLSILFSFSLGFCQTESSEEELSLDKSNLAGQFDFVSKKSSSWRDDKGQKYEVIKVQYLQALKAHSIDSIKAIKTDLIKANSEIKNQEKEISTLKNSLSNTQNNLTRVTGEKDNINFLGMPLSKAGYNTLLFSIIAVLLALCALFAFKFKNSNVLTKEAKSKLKEVEAEFDEHRKTALEREQKVRRQLQDEINKNRNK